MAKDSFGQYFKQLRIKTGRTLRAFCQEHGYDPGNLSRLERGLLAPPQGEEKLSEYAKALGLKRGSDEWYEFFDRAALAKGELPKTLLTDEEVLEKLPVLFRTLRGQPVPADKLKELIEAIRRS
ncbi:MAG: helix-turn-helix domain-containing protein [Acidobacteria bacterium]|nr:helix-turn-helix domain-containing protein [Acidobacteriota bacterium]